MKNKDWGRGRGRGGLLTSSSEKGGLIREGGAYLRGGLNRGFTVSVSCKQPNDKTARTHIHTLMNKAD